MGKEKILYIILGVLFVTYVIVEYYSPKPLDWTVTYAQNDKNPYGGYILYDRLDDFFTDKAVSFQTLYEEADSAAHLLILATHFNPSDADIEAIFSILDQGRTVLVGAGVFSDSFLDALQIGAEFHPLEGLTEDSIAVNMTATTVQMPASFINFTFNTDSSKLWEVHARAEGAVLISKQYPESRLILTSVPFAFSNYGLVHQNVYLFVEEALNKIPPGDIHYNRFYHVGKQEPATPLRYVLSQAPLRWALFLTVLVVVLYLVFGSQRLQRAIPVLEPLQNTTIQFIKTIGALYYRERNHKNAALKLTSHFTNALGSRYYIHAFNESTFKTLSAKSGVPLEDVAKTFDLIQAVKQSTRVSEEMLKQLYEKIRMFKNH